MIFTENNIFLSYSEVILRLFTFKFFLETLKTFFVINYRGGTEVPVLIMKILYASVTLDPSKWFVALG